MMIDDTAIRMMCALALAPSPDKALNSISVRNTLVRLGYVQRVAKFESGEHTGLMKNELTPLGATVLRKLTSNYPDAEKPVFAPPHA